MQSSSEVVKMRADSGKTPKESMTNRRQTVGSEPTGAPKDKWARFGVLAGAMVLFASVALGQAPSGRRPRISSNAVPGEPMSYSLYTPELNLMSQTTPSTASNPPIAHEYIWFGGQPVAQIDAATNTTRTTFTDHLGTPILQTDATGAVIWRAEYEPYGDVRQMRVGTATDQPLRLPGQEVAMTSEGSEENYNIFRWYRAGWGRYSQADPMGLHGGLNVYGYTKGNPIIDFDPLGLCCSNQDYGRQLLLAYSIATLVQQTNFWSQVFSGGIFKRGAGQPNGCGLNADNLVQALNSQLTCWQASRTDAGPAIFGFTCRRIIPHSFATLSPLDRCCDAKDPGKIAIDNYFGWPSMTPFPDPSKAPL
jgi:RHS repeat-associated protein